MKSQLFYKVGLQGWNWILKIIQPCSQGWFTMLDLTSQGWKVKVGGESVKVCFHNVGFHNVGFYTVGFSIPGFIGLVCMHTVFPWVDVIRVGPT